MTSRPQDRTVSPAGSLDAAWAAAEALLPAGFTVSVSKTAGVSSGPYVAVTDYGSAAGGYAYAETPTAALEALAVRLAALSEQGTR